MGSSRPWLGNRLGPGHRIGGPLSNGPGRRFQEATKRARDKWHYRGQVRPEFAEAPEDGQESVWDYPRPPRVSADRREVRVLFRDTVIASSTSSVRVMETASPPTFYIPLDDIQMAYVEKGVGSSLCGLPARRVR